MDRILFTLKIWSQGFICFFTGTIYHNIYTPGIYADGYIVFAFPFICSLVRSLVRSLFQNVRGIYVKVFVKRVQVGKDQEKAQPEKDPHSKNRGGKKPNQQPVSLVVYIS